MIRGVRLLFFLGALASPQLFAYEQPSFAALLQLDDKEFLQAAQEATISFYTNQSPYTVDQLIAIAEKCAAATKPIGSTSTSEFGENPFREYVAEACKKVNDRQLDKLVEIYVRLDPNSFEKSYTLPVLASRVLAREVAAVPQQHVELGDDEPTLLAEIESAPEELKNAWRAFQRAKAPFETAFPKPTEVIEVSANMKSFYELIGDALRGAKGREKEVRRFAWTGANCLGITDIEDAQDIAILLMLLREGRMNEAIGAALRVAGTQGSSSSPQELAKPVIDLLERCGLNWEEIFAGGQVESEARGWAGESRNPYLDALASYGSERAAPLVEQLAHFAKPAARAKFLTTAGAWIEGAPNLRKCSREGGETLSVYSSEQKTRLASPMPQTVQEMALHLTEELATVETPSSEADIAIHTFARTQAPSSIPALQALARHSSSDVATHARNVLCAMGVDSGHQSVAGPIRFQILVNGKPFTGTQTVGWTIASKDQSVHATAPVTPDGIVELPREHFTNPERPATRVTFAVVRMGENGIVFDTKVSPPWDLDGVTKLDLRLSALEITLQNREGLNAPPPEKAFVSIERILEDRNDAAGPQDVNEITAGVSAPANFYDEDNEVTANPTIRVPAVQEGKYQVSVGVPGAAIWSGTVAVGEKPAKISASLKPGSDLRFEIVAPGGIRNFWAPIFKDGKAADVNMDFRTKTFRALPCGKYVVKIAGSELEGEDRHGKKLTRGPDEIPFAGREVSFAVEKGSPAVIDLGEIHLEPLPR